MRLLLLVTLSTFLLSCDPHPLQGDIEALYPSCQVIRIKDIGREHVEASLQCGPVVKTVMYRSY